MLKIISTHSAKLSELEILQLHDIIRIAYEKTEKEIWGPNYVRLFLDEFTTLVNKGEVLVAFLDGKIVGGVHAYMRDVNVYSFSLLGVDFDFGGQGIGTALINKVEAEAKQKGATQVNIEILRIKNRDVPHKIVLAKYYERLGYKYSHSDDCKCIIPDWKYKKLVLPSNFDFYSKKL